MSALEIKQFICRSDNFGVLIHDAATGQTASIDAPEEAKVRAALQEAGWRLTHIFTTHHHQDHVEGHLGLKQETGCVIYGPEKEAAKIPGIDHTVKDGDEISFGSFKIKVLETPGHTLGHVSFYIPEAKVAFVGDTLFSIACGRVLEGTYPMMYASLQKIAALPGETQIYCGHEYTRANLPFALTMEPDNVALQARQDEVEALYAVGKPTLPVILADELKINPFLRPQSATIRKTVGLGADASDAEVFAAVRSAKDKF